MDWSNERFVRLYTRDTPEWLCWCWQARALWPLLLRKADRSGVIANKLGARGLAALAGLPVDVVEAGLPDLLADGCLAEHQLGLVIPNYIEAQEAPLSDKQRQRESRERRRDLVSAGLRPDQRREVVYFIRAESGGPIKIGFTDDVAKRLSSMQSNHPDNLVLLATTEGSSDEEKSLHARFRHLRTRGEWFNPGDDLISYINELRDVTNRDPSHAVTRHEVSRDVTPRHSDPIRAVPILSDQIPDLSRHARAIPPVPVRHGPEHAIPPAIGDRDPSPANAILSAYDPEDPRARGRLAESTYRQVSDALRAVAAELGLPAPLPFPPIGPSTSAGSFRDLQDRVREEGANAPAVCERVVANLIAQARADRSVEWLAEKSFGERPWRTARAWTPGKTARAGPQSNPTVGRVEPPPASAFRRGVQKI